MENARITAGIASVRPEGKIYRQPARLCSINASSRGASKHPENAEL
jgi:hypothetical protein